MFTFCNSQLLVFQSIRLIIHGTDKPRKFGITRGADLMMESILYKFIKLVFVAYIYYDFVKVLIKIFKTTALSPI